MSTYAYNCYKCGKGTNVLKNSACPECFRKEQEQLKKKKK